MSELLVLKSANRFARFMQDERGEGRFLQPAVGWRVRTRLEAPLNCRLGLGINAPDANLKIRPPPREGSSHGPLQLWINGSNQVDCKFEIEVDAQARCRQVAVVDAA